MSKRGRAHTTSGHKIDTKKLEPIFFTNEFVLSDPERAFNGIKFVIENDPACTRTGPGRHEFSTESPVIAHFKRLLTFYEDKDDLEIKRLVVQQTGISMKGSGLYDYGKIDDSLLRIIVNLRPGAYVPPRVEEDEEAQPMQQPRRQVPRTVGVKVHIAGSSTWIITRRSYGTILPGELTNISIASGKLIPETRHDNTCSLFVVMDIKPLRGTRVNVADRLCTQNPVKGAVVIQQLRKIMETKEGGEAAQQLREMMGVESEEATPSKAARKDGEVDTAPLAVPNDENPQNVSEQVDTVVNKDGEVDTASAPLAVPNDENPQNEQANKDE